MNVYIKLVLQSSFLISAMSQCLAAEQRDIYQNREHRSQAHVSSEPFIAAMQYEIILKNSEAKRKETLAKRQVVTKRFGKQTYIAKSNSEVNSLRSVVAKVLPANMQFEIVHAYDNDDGDITVKIETERVLPELDSNGIEEIVSLKTDGYIARQPKAVPLNHSDYSMTLPTGWDKERGYSAILQRLSDNKENETLTTTVSIVFDNTGSVASWAHAPYADEIKALIERRRGEMYGLSSTRKELVWWTQDITLDQATALYESSLVINMVPRD